MIFYVVFDMTIFIYRNADNNDIKPTVKGQRIEVNTNTNKNSRTTSSNWRRTYLQHNYKQLQVTESNVDTDCL